MVGQCLRKNQHRAERYDDEACSDDRSEETEGCLRAHALHHSRMPGYLVASRTAIQENFLRLLSALQQAVQLAVSPLWIFETPTFKTLLKAQCRLISLSFLVQRIQLIVAEECSFFSAY